MAQTKKKRHTKHRGNAAGVVEARGRTGRKPTAEERKSEAKLTAAERREQRLSQPPTWKGAATRSAFAALIFGVLVVLAFGQSVSQAVALTGFVFLFYIPLSYYTDQWMYKRNQRKVAAKQTS